MPHSVRKTLASIALLTACLAPPAMTRTERRALANTVSGKKPIERTTNLRDKQSSSAFAFFMLTLNYEWKLIVATLSVPLSRKLRS